MIGTTSGYNDNNSVTQSSAYKAILLPGGRMMIDIAEVHIIVL